MNQVPELGVSMDDCAWNVPGMLLARSRLTPEAIALWRLSPSGEWLGSTWSEYCQAVAALSRGFRELGLGNGERVGILAPSCREWDFAQLAILAAGGVAVGLDPHGLDEHLCEIARRTGLDDLVVGDPSQLARIGVDERRQLRFAVCLDDAEAAGTIPFRTLVTAGPVGDGWNLAQADTPATIVFTSGATGEPKGIEYSHRQMCLATAAILAAFPEVGAGSRLACWLPLSNLFQRMINLSAIGRGAQTYYVGDPREIMRHVQAIAPHLFIGVPRFFEKLHAGIDDAVAQQPAWQQALVRWAWRIGEQRAAALRAGSTLALPSRLQFALAERLVLRKLRGVLGPNLRFLVSGSAPMPRRLLERFHGLGLLILEAYGVSENIVPISLNRPACFRFGTVGQAVPGNEIRLVADGELQVRGAGVFAAYLGEDRVASSLDADGYLSTGDFAAIDSDGFISLIGRKSDIFKTSTGRRIAPAGIEGRLQQVSALEHSVIFGAGRPQPVALLVITEAAWQAEGPESFGRLRHEVGAAVKELPAYQRPAGLLITAQALTIAGGELTPNLKLRRHVIATRHGAALQALYAEIDAARGGAFEVWSADRQVFSCSP